jgi:hypothetical protein
MWHELRALQIMLPHNAIRVPPSFITPTVPAILLGDRIRCYAILAWMKRSCVP